MTYTMFFDTETTGKADFKLAPGLPAQPHVVSLAAALYGEDGAEVQAVRLVLQPDSHTSCPEALAAHGITREFQQRVGVPRLVALSVFNWLAKAADAHVAFNYDFDRLVLDGEFLRIGRPSPLVDTKAWCEMKAMTDLCRIPSPYRSGQFKWPKLQEAHKHAFGEEFINAHDAMADVRSTARVHFWRLAQNGPPETVKAEANP